MNKQLSLSILNDELLQVRTKKKEFLEKIERIVLWGDMSRSVNAPTETVIRSSGQQIPDFPY